MGDASDLLFVGAGRWIVALDRFSGRPVWRRKLPRLFGGLITILTSGEEVYAGRGGYVYCLDRGSGEVLWERGVGSSGHTVMLAISGADSGPAQAAAAHAQEAAEAAAASASGAGTAVVS